MADPLTPEEMEADHRRQIAAEEARRFLEAQGVAGYSSPAPAMSMGGGEQSLPPIGPPAPAAPEKPGMLGRGLKNAAIVGAGALLGGPVGYQLASGYVTSQSGPQAPGKEEPKPAESAEPAGPPTPPEQGDDVPIIMQQPGGGRPTQVSPAGMYPHSQSAMVHQGRPVPTEAKMAFGGSTALALEGAQQQRDADRQYNQNLQGTIQARMQATESAAIQHARVAAERDSLVRQRLAEIEALNKEASAQIDPNKYWHDRTAGAQVVGTLAVALGGFGDRLLGRENGALKIIESGINREIQTQMMNRQLAGQKATRAQTLLQLHLDRLGDQDKAIDATKLALWDNVAMQVEQLKAERGAQVSDAALLQMQSDILEKRGELVNKIGIQETDDINRQYTEQWHNAQYTGGAAGGSPAGKMEGYELIPVPASDRTAEKNELIAVPKGSHEKLGAAVGATNTIIGINQEALERIKEIRKDIEAAKRGEGGAISRIQSNRKLLEDLGQRKASYLSSSEGQGVLKEAEFERAMADRVLFSDWWKPGVDVEKRIQGQNNSLTGAAGRMVQGYGGQRVKMAYTRDKNGALQPTPLFKGQMYTPDVVGPEMGPVK